MKYLVFLIAFLEISESYGLDFNDKNKSFSNVGNVSTFDDAKFVMLANELNATNLNETLSTLKNDSKMTENVEIFSTSSSSTFEEELGTKVEDASPSEPNLVPDVNKSNLSFETTTLLEKDGKKYKNESPSSTSTSPILKPRLSDRFLYYEITNLNFLPKEEFSKGELANFWFSAFQNVYNVTITSEDSSLIAKDTLMEIKSDNFTFSYRYNHGIGGKIKTVEGRVRFSPGSFVYGVLKTHEDSKPKFKGFVNKDNEIIYIEPLGAYSNEDRNSDKVLIYKKSDVIHPLCSADGEGGISCQPNPDVIKRSDKNITVSRKTREEESKNGDERSRYKNSYCSLEIVVDRWYLEAHGSRDEVVAEIVVHIKSADEVFRNSDFDQDGRPDNVGFMIKKFNFVRGVNFFGENDPDARRKSINGWCASKKSSECLALCFTHYESYGILSSSYLPSPERHPLMGGICSVPRTIGYDKWVNLNILTINSFVSQLQIAPMALVSHTVNHGLGHTFGATHDPKEIRCSPGGTYGNYLMTNSLEMPKGRNAERFSPCSLKEIVANLKSDVSKCFAKFTQPYCGNAITEAGEECDCGRYDDCDANDHCCIPRGGAGGRPGCTLRSGYKCSIHQTCCTANCTFLPATLQQVCRRSESDCIASSVCNGRQGDCPEMRPRQDGTACHSGAYTCSVGHCNSTVCVDHRLNNCECSGRADQLCHVCCLTASGECISSRDLNFLSPSGAIFHKYPGDSCNRFKGYCNVNGVCISRGLVAKKSVGAWFEENWTYLLNVLLLILVLAALIFLLLYKKRKPEQPPIVPAKPSAPPTKEPPSEPQAQIKAPPRVEQELDPGFQIKVSHDM